LSHEAAEFKQVPNSQVKQLPRKTGPAAINIYGNKVAIIHWSKETPFAIVINNKDIAESYKEFFKLLWK